MRMPHVAVAALCIELLIGCTVAPHPKASNLVSAIEKGPVSPDGDVAGRPTDLVIHYAIDQNPAVPGRTLRAGRSVRVTLPEEFVDSGLVPLLDYASDARCGPQRLECSTAAFVQGFPQSPVPFGKYTVQRSGRTLTLTAKEDIGFASPTAPGIKAVHLLLRGYRNPPPGSYRIDVESETGAHGEPERGSGLVAIRATTHPSINLTSVFDQPATLPRTSPPTRLSSQHQLAATNSALPLPYNLLLWDSAGAPLDGVRIEPVAASTNVFALKRGESEVGRVEVQAPRSAVARLTSTAPSTVVKAPITFLPVARLQAHFETGSEPGDYRLLWTLHGGNRLTTHVFVPHDG